MLTRILLLLATSLSLLTTAAAQYGQERPRRVTPPVENTAPPLGAAAGSTQYLIYAEAGDTPRKIAAREGEPLDELERVNGVDADLILLAPTPADRSVNHRRRLVAQVAPATHAAPAPAAGQSGPRARTPGAEARRPTITPTWTARGYVGRCSAGALPAEPPPAAATARTASAATAAGRARITGAWRSGSEGRYRRADSLSVSLSVEVNLLDS